MKKKKLKKIIAGLVARIEKLENEKRRFMTFPFPVDKPVPKAKDTLIFQDANGKSTKAVLPKHDQPEYTPPSPDYWRAEDVTKC